MTLPFTTEEEWKLAGEEANRLLKDMTINQAFLTMAKSRILVGLAKQVLDRSLREENASEHMFEYLTEVVDDKVNRDGTAVDLTDLLDACSTVLPAMLQEELGRLESQEHVSDLRRMQLQRDSTCQIKVLDRWLDLYPGNLMVIAGSSDKVSRAINFIATSGEGYRYISGDAVQGADMMYLLHSFPKNGGAIVPNQRPVSEWRGKARSSSSWAKFLRLISRRYFTIISNILLAAENKKVSKQEALYDTAILGINSVSVHLHKGMERTVAGLYVPKSNTSEFMEKVEEAVRACPRENVCLVNIGMESDV